ncbi:MAG: excisionase [Treponema sp.]|nr:excisionase [Treponema sp.]
MRYTLMHKTIPVAALEIDLVTNVISKVWELYRPEHLPVGVVRDNRPLKDSQFLNEWWLGRTIPASRSGLREALALMGVHSTRVLLLKGFGLSLSDQYWICPADGTLQWEDVNFFENPFSEDVGNALFGRSGGAEELNLMSPDNTSDGWLKKKWVIAEGKRMLLKGGSLPAYQEPFNEVIATAMLSRLKVPHTPYTLTWNGEQPLSVCEDFITTETELVSAWHIFETYKKPNHVSTYQHFLACCDTLAIPGIREHIDHVLVLDYLIANTDRHFNNFGVVRNAETLTWLGPAPIFDCGTSMWHDQFTAQIRPAFKIPSKPFRSEHNDQIGLVTSFDWLDFNALQGIDEEYGEILKDSSYIDDDRRSRLCFALKTRIQMLKERIGTQL